MGDNGDALTELLLKDGDCQHSDREVALASVERSVPAEFNQDPHRFIEFLQKGRGTKFATGLSWFVLLPIAVGLGSNMIRSLEAIERVDVETINWVYITVPPAFLYFLGKILLSYFPPEHAVMRIMSALQDGFETAVLASSISGVALPRESLSFRKGFFSAGIVSGVVDAEFTLRGKPSAPTASRQYVIAVQKGNDVLLLDMHCEFWAIQRVLQEMRQHRL